MKETVHDLRHRLQVNARNPVRLERLEVDETLLAFLLDALHAGQKLNTAATSLVSGVEDLQAAWPRLDTKNLHELEELCGFLFATLPLTQRSLWSPE